MRPGVKKMSHQSLKITPVSKQNKATSQTNLPTSLLTTQPASHPSAQPPSPGVARGRRQRRQPLDVRKYKSSKIVFYGRSIFGNRSPRARARARALFGRAHIFLAGDRGVKQLQFHRIWTRSIPRKTLIEPDRMFEVSVFQKLLRA